MGSRTPLWLEDPHPLRCRPGLLGRVVRPTLPGNGVVAGEGCEVAGRPGFVDPTLGRGQGWFAHTGPTRGGIRPIGSSCRPMSSRSCRDGLDLMRGAAALLHDGPTAPRCLCSTSPRSAAANDTGGGLSGASGGPGHPCRCSLRTGVLVCGDGPSPWPEGRKLARIRELGPDVVVGIPTSRTGPSRFSARRCPRAGAGCSCSTNIGGAPRRGEASQLVRARVGGFSAHGTPRRPLRADRPAGKRSATAITVTGIEAVQMFGRRPEALHGAGAARSGRRRGSRRSSVRPFPLAESKCRTCRDRGPPWSSEKNSALPRAGDQPRTDPRPKTVPGT